MASLFLFLLGSSLCIPIIAALDFAGPADNNSSSNYTNSNEVEALTRISRMWKISGWDPPPNRDPCWPEQGSWPHLNCSCNSPNPPPSNSCNIYSLDLSRQNIPRNITLELFKLTELRNLALNKNLLFGPVPPEIGNLIHLEYLDLSINMLSGNLPSQLGNLTKLIFLNFSSNKFNGVLPDLGNLTSLENLRFDSSGVNGTLDNLGKLNNLTTLWAFDNNITGNLSAVTNFRQLKDLRIYGTQIEQPIPTSFSSLTELEILILGDLGQSSIQTATPDFEFLSSLRKLSTLSLRNCGFNGDLPNSLQGLTQLAYLDLSFNRFSGNISDHFKNLNLLQHLYLGSNNLNGTISDFFQPQDGGLSSKLTALDISFNNISGSLMDVPENVSLNYVGTSIYPSGNQSDNMKRAILSCINSKCNANVHTRNTTLAINCGGELINSSPTYLADSSPLGPATLMVDTGHQWVVSNVGSYVTKLDTDNFTVSNDTVIDNPLYQTARRSASSLRYYIVGLDNGNYTVDLYFAEIVIGDNSTWQGLGKRYFDIHVQGSVTKDFNIIEQANGSGKPWFMSYHVSVTDEVLNIHLFWAGKGTCCIPENDTYGPLVSAIVVTPELQPGPTPPPPSSNDNSNRHKGVIVGIALLCIAGAVMFSSIMFLWWGWIAITRLHDERKA